MARMPATLLLALAAVACAPSHPSGIYYASGDGAITPDGLHRVRWEPFSVTYVKPGADLARYDKVLVEAVTISYKTPPRPADLQDAAIHPNYALPDSAIASMKRYFHRAFVTSLGRSAVFSVADVPGPDVLRVRGHIVDLWISALPEADQAPDETDYASSAGSMTLVLDADDSLSGEPLVRVGQAQAIQMTDASWYQVDPVSGSQAIQQIFDGWADQLRRELDQFHALPELPAVPTQAPSASR